QAAAQYQPKDRDAFVRYVQENPMAAAQLRAPLYEDKVVDFLFSKAEISDRTVDRAELEADLESEEGLQLGAIDRAVADLGLGEEEIDNLVFIERSPELRRGHRVFLNVTDERVAILRLILRGCL